MGFCKGCDYRILGHVFDKMTIENVVIICFLGSNVTCIPIQQYYHESLLLVVVVAAVVMVVGVGVAVAGGEPL